MTVTAATRLAIFPLTGAVLFPRMHLPLHIFEPRYRAMVSESLSRDRRIGMVQPRAQTNQKLALPPLYDIGCVGKIADVEALDDGRYNLVLEGVARFRILRELTVETLFRQVEAEILEEQDDSAVLSLAERACIEQEAQRYANAQGYMVDWDGVSQLDDEALVNGIAQIAPFDAASKQALLEADTLSLRADLAIQLMQFFGRHDGDDRVTLQ
jgi:uncharacterized protein